MNYEDLMVDTVRVSKPEGQSGYRHTITLNTTGDSSDDDDSSISSLSSIPSSLLSSY